MIADCLVQLDTRAPKPSRTRRPRDRGAVPEQALQIAVDVDRNAAAGTVVSSPPSGMVVSSPGPAVSSSGAGGAAAVSNGSSSATATITQTETKSPTPEKPKRVLKGFARAQEEAKKEEATQDLKAIQA